MPAFKVPYYQVLIPVLLLLQACSGNKPDKEKSEAEKQIVVRGYSEIVYFTYESAYNSALTLGQAVDSFLENPSQLTLDRAREAWRAARVPYNFAEAYRFYDGPIDNGAQGVEGLLNAWPLDEVYVDYVDGAPDAGIINNRKDYPEITKDLLISLNEHGGEENISTGYHAIEFMLWGQDLSADGPGKRPYTDFLDTAPNGNRRAQYLRLTTEILIQDLAFLVDQWKPGMQNNYRVSFEHMPADEALQKMLTGMAVLCKVEMAGERMYTPYDNASQEDELSCFSDNTRDDLIQQLEGVIHIYYATVPHMDSLQNRVSIASLLKEKDPDLFTSTEALLHSTMGDMQQIYAPFDQAIILDNERPQVLKATLSMQKLGEQFALIAKALGLQVNVNVSV